MHSVLGSFCMNHCVIAQRPVTLADCRKHERLFFKTNSESQTVSTSPFVEMHLYVSLIVVAAHS